METFLQMIIDGRFLIASLVALSLLLLWLLRILMDEDRSAIFRGKLYHALAIISGRRDHEKKFIGHDVRGRLNLARRQLHFGQSVMPEAVSVDWAEPNSAGSYDVREGEFVIRLDPRQDQALNTVAIAEAIVSRTTLSGIRHLTPTPLARAVDLTLIKKLLQRCGRPRALDAFYSRFYSAAQPRNGRNWLETVAAVDEAGLFERLLLVELEDFSRAVLPLDPRPYMIGEIEGLVNWIHRCATRQEGEEVPLEYTKAHLRVGIVLVAKTQTIMSRGIEPYLQAVRFHRRDGIWTIYLVIWDKPHLSWTAAQVEYGRLCGSLRDAIAADPGIMKHFSTDYEYNRSDGERMSGVITRYKVRDTSTS